MPDKSPAPGPGPSPEHVHVFISYTHDSPAHKARVRALADRLLADGVDAEIDQYQTAPPQGWPQWMQQHIADARFVLVVCSATYYRRAMGRERPGVGRGAIFESLAITQALYEAQGRNERFIPVLFDRADEVHIPDFLKAYQRYVVAEDDGYDALYRHLTVQPAVVKPPLGQRRILPSEPLAQPSNALSDAGALRAPVAAGGAGSPLILLRTDEGTLHFTPLLEVEQRDELRVVLQPDASDVRALLGGWVGDRFRRPGLGVAYHDTAMRVHVREIVRRADAYGDRFELTLTPEEDRHGFVSEMGTTGFSVDDIAALRARRLLLNEPLPPSDGRHGTPQHDMLESLVAGFGRKLPMRESPLPGLYAQVRGTSLESRFEDAARLVCVLWLQLSGTVAHVHELELQRTSRDTLHMRFRGERRRYYTNQPPTRIEVEGECRLE